MMKYLQNIGRSLMLPVAVLPAAAILMGVGYWIDPIGWGSNSAVAAFFIKAGGAIITQIPVLFAVGIALGMSRNQDGAAALSGLVAYLVVTTLLSKESIGLLQGIPVENVDAAFGKIENAFIGIISGLVAASLYNRFSGVQLPDALAFFSGKRLVPIVTSLAMIAVSALLYFLWPLCYNALVAFGESISTMGAFGAAIYGFLNKLLIPMGLHHAINSVFWFDVAGINDIGNYWAGTGVKGVTGMYQAGYFPIMMFGLPAAGLAIYHTAKPARKKQVASLMLAGAFASFFTGVTEPIEFAFLFAAPFLYVIHAVLTGLSMAIAAGFQWIAGFGFSAGLIDFVLSSRVPMANQPYMLLVQGVLFFALYYVIFRFCIVKFNIKTPGREDEENSESAEQAVGKSNFDAMAHTILAGLGGKENLVTIDNCITRLRLEIKDMALVDEAKIKSAGVAGVVKVSQTNLQVVVGTQVQFVADALKQL